MICRSCQKKIYKLNKIKDSFRGSTLYFCATCNLLQTQYSKKYNPILDPHSTKFEGKRYVSMTSGSRWGNIRHGKELRFNAHLDLLEKIIKKNNITSVFDDGANRGTFARYAKKNKLTYYGCEPDKLCAESYDKKTPKVYLCKTEDFKLKKKVNLIYSSHTLEHVENLKKHLSKFKQLLKSDGILFLETPNTNQIFLDKNIFEEYFIDKHVNHFCLNSLLGILVNKNFYLEEVYSNKYNLTLILRLLNLPKNKILKKKKIINNYYKNKKNTEKKIQQLAVKINKIKKNRSCLFYGGGRILNSFFDNFLNSNNVIKILDNYLSGKVDKNHGIKIVDDSFLKSINNKKIPIFIFARDANDQIIQNLNNKGFNNIFSISNLI